MVDVILSLLIAAAGIVAILALIGVIVWLAIMASR